MLSANFKPKRTAAASRGFLATARLSGYYRRASCSTTALRGIANANNLLSRSSVVSHDVEIPRVRGHVLDLFESNYRYTDSLGSF